MKRILMALMLTVVVSAASQTVNPDPWTWVTGTSKEVTYRNPVLPGFYPDPSVCRVGSDYYLVNSTFEYFPGVPVFHSTDLVNWTQIGHVIDRKEQLKGEINIFAPTIRYHDGLFYMITTNVAHGGNFFVTATNPAGPWSEAVWIDMPNIDPDLFFDDDGSSYVITSAFELAQIDIKTGKLIGERRKIWNSTGGRYPEAPHIYKKDGFYYLMAAEGGTEEAHSVTIARSNNIWGPYIDNPANPIATHVGHAGMGNPIQGIGHADIIQAHDHSWWMVLHGYRSITDYPPHHILGRETCLVPVVWPEGGWPVVNGNGTLSVDMRCNTLPQSEKPASPVRTGFNSDKPGLEWNYIQYPEIGNYTIDKEKSTLTLRGSALKIGDKGSPSFVGRRLSHLGFAASTRIDFDPAGPNEEAGLAIVNNGVSFKLMIVKNGSKRCLAVKLQFGQTNYVSDLVEIKPGFVDLKIEEKSGRFVFSYSQGGSAFKFVDQADAKYLSSQTVGWFTGCYLGMYSTGNGTKCRSKATYHWFDYEPSGAK